MLPHYSKVPHSGTTLSQLNAALSGWGDWLAQAAASYAALAWAYYSQRCDAASLRPTLLWKLMGALALRWPQSGYRMVATCKRRISGAQLVVTVPPSTRWPRSGHTLFIDRADVALMILDIDIIYLMKQPYYSSLVLQLSPSNFFTTVLARRHNPLSQDRSLHNYF